MISATLPHRGYGNQEIRCNTRDDVMQADRGVSSRGYTTAEGLTNFKFHYMCYPVTAYERGRACVVNPNLINEK